MGNNKTPGIFTTSNKNNTKSVYGYKDCYRCMEKAYKKDIN